MNVSATTAMSRPVKNVIPRALGHLRPLRSAVYSEVFFVLLGMEHPQGLHGDRRRAKRGEGTRTRRARSPMKRE
jgi:hypothetical protein